MKTEIRMTLDGSQTLYIEEIDEHYHSTFGAIQESQHIFIREGFDLCTLAEVKVLEIGFGTGLNCYLTLLNGLKKDQQVHYYSVEKYPVPETIWRNLEYSNHFPDSDSGFFESIHTASWNSDVVIDRQFTLRKIECDALQFDLIDLPSFDVVYFDAFSPDKQPEIWDHTIFERLYSRMNEHGILVTYCAKGQIRRLLQTVGFRVERIPGPPGKREMLRARK